MSNDYALLFEKSRKSRLDAWELVLSATRTFGAKYVGIATRLSWIDDESSWHLTTQTTHATSHDAVAALISEWNGLAFELETRFGPMKVLIWDAGSNETGIGLYQNSYAVSLQAEEPDVMDIFEQASLEIAGVLGSNLAVLVGDPSLRAWREDDLMESLAASPLPTMEPLVYWAAWRPADSHGRTLPATVEWIQHSTGTFHVYVNPAFPTGSD